MEANNTALWNSVCKTDPAFTKQFKRAGGFSGTAISPMYMVRRATEIFGPIGIGWGFKELEHNFIEGVWSSRVQVWYLLDGKRGEVEQWGATTMLNTLKDGRGFVDEEAAKKSVTDAVTKCLSYMGFSADVHMGMYDDNKYVAELQKEKREPKSAASKVGAAPDEVTGSREAQQAVVDRKLAEMKSAPTPQPPPASVPTPGSIAAPRAPHAGDKPVTTAGKSDFQKMLDAIHALKLEFEELKATDRYYFVLGQHGFEKSNQIRKVDEGRQVYKELLGELKAARDRAPLEATLPVSAADMPDGDQSTMFETARQSAAYGVD